MPLGAVPTGRQSTSGESGDQVRLLLISLASFSFSNAFAAQQPNGFNQPNYRAHSNLKNHDRSRKLRRRRVPPSWTNRAISDRKSTRLNSVTDQSRMPSSA